MSSSSSTEQVSLRQGGIIAGCGAEGATEEEFRRWKCIYPNYIDKSKSTKEGRRLSRGRAVDRPVVGEMAEVLQKYNVPFIVENKAYSRDWLVRGRVRVNLTAVKDDSVNTKFKLMHRMAAEIPMLTSRSERLSKEAAQLEALERTKGKEAKKALKSKRK